MVAPVLTVKGHAVEVEAVQSNDPRIAPFEADHPSQRWCIGRGRGLTSSCAHCSLTWQTGPARIAASGSGKLVAVARVGTCRNGDVHGHLVVTVAEPFEDSDLAASLLGALRYDLVEAGLDRLYACLLYQEHDVLRDCRTAGFEVESMLAGGGISEVVLRVGGRPSARTARPL